MERENFTFVSEVDGLEISAMAVIPEEIKGVVQLVHGMCEYKERYLPFMEFLAGKGYAAVIHDHRGHGKSIKSPEDLGYMYEGGKEGLIEDTYQMLKLTKERFGELPYCLLGHSMGSLVVRCFVKKYDGEIDKLLVVGSPSKNNAAGAGYSLAGLAEKLKGGKGYWKVLDYMVTDMAYEKPFKKEGRHAWISSDPEVVRKYNEDPGCGYRFTINGYKGLIGLCIDTYDAQGWAMKNPELPIKFFSGENDPGAVNRKAWEESLQFMKTLGYKNVDGIMYENMRHEVLNEKEKEKVWADVLEFIEK